MARLARFVPGIRLMSVATCLPGAPIGRAGPLSPGQLCLALEDDSQFILVTGHGLWTPSQMDAHLRDYNRLLLQTRRPGRGARVIVNLKDVGIQSPDVTAVLESRTRQYHRDGDRIAMIVPGSLAKMQMRRVLGTHLHTYFGSDAAARNWLAGVN